MMSVLLVMKGLCDYKMLLWCRDNVVDWCELGKMVVLMNDWFDGVMVDVVVGLSRRRLVKWERNDFERWCEEFMSSFFSDLGGCFLGFDLVVFFLVSFGGFIYFMMVVYELLILNFYWEWESVVMNDILDVWRFVFSWVIL